MKRKFRCNASGGIITVEIKGDIGGNSQEARIKMEDGQFPFGEIQKTTDSLTLTLVGTWELMELAEALGSLLKPPKNTPWWKKLLLKGSVPEHNWVEEV